MVGFHLKYCTMKGEVKNHEATLAELELEKPRPSDGQIACQYKPTRNVMARFLFDLQIVAFVVLKKARCICNHAQYF